MKSYWFFLFFSFLFFEKAFSKDSINNSFEWLCADAGLIVKGKLLSYTKNEYQINSWFCTFKSETVIRGSAKITFVFLVKNFSEDSLKKYIENQTDLIVFLKENRKKYKNKNLETTWYAMETCNLYPAVINLKQPAFVLISAFSFEILTKPEEILYHCYKLISLISEYEASGKVVLCNFVEVPKNSFAYSVLFCKDICFLCVPDFLFPYSIKKLSVPKN